MRVSGEWVSVQDTAIAAATAASIAAAEAAAAAEVAAAEADAAAVAAQYTADRKNRVYRQANQPTGDTYEAGDLWFDTDADNKTSRYSAASTSSISAKQASGGTATLTTAITHAFVPGQTVSVSGVGAPFDGSFIITAVPTTTTFQYAAAGTVSFSGASGSASGAAGFYEVLYGNNSLANLSANKLTSGSIDAGVITVSNLDAGNISTGYLAAARIEVASLSGDKITSRTIDAVKIKVASISAVEIAVRTITAAEIAVGTITADEIAVETITAAEIEAGSITVDRLTAGTLTAFTLRTSSGARRVTVSASTNSISFTESSSTVGHIGPASTSGIIMHYGSTFNPAATTYPHAYVSSGSAQIAYSSGIYCEASSTGIVMNGNVFTLDQFYNQDPVTSGNAANTRMDTDGRTRRSTASSQRYKENIVGLRTVAHLDPNKLLTLPVRAFSYKTDYLDAADDRAGLLLPGFVAEEVAEIYPIAADKDKGIIESWNDRIIVPGMLALIQDLHARVETLEKK
jgi:hypothetical protein